MSTRTNLVPNPSLETNTTSWVVSAGTGGTAAASSFATGTPTATTGAKCIRLAWTVGSTSPNGYIATQQAANLPAVAGRAYTWSAYVRSSRAQVILPRIVFRDAAQAALATIDGAGVALAANAWTRIDVTATAPANAAYVQGWAIGATAAAGGVNWVAGDTLDLDGALLEQGALGAYFDGDTPSTGAVRFAWTGTAHASSSTSVTVTAVASLVGTQSPPRVQVTVSDLVVGDSVTVTGVAGDYEWTARGGTIAHVASTEIRILDNLGPINAPFHYRVSVNGAAGIDTNTITVPYPRDYVLGSADGLVVVELGQWANNTDPREQHIEQSITYVPGRRLPVVRYAPAGGDSGAWVLTTRTATETQRLADLIAAGAPLMMRTDGTTRDFEPVIFAVVTSAKRALLGSEDQTRRWDVEWTAVEDPLGGASLSGDTFASVDAGYSGTTFAALDATYPGTTFSAFNGYDWGGNPA